MGTGEYVFGTSLGHLRSQEDTPHTFHVFPPQLTDTCNDGTTIVGNGFVTQIDTTCTCSNSMRPHHLIAAGVDATKVNQMINLSMNSTMPDTLTQHIYRTGENVTIVSFLKGTNVCGGINATSPRVPVCTTTFSNHSNALIMAEYGFIQNLTSFV